MSFQSHNGRSHWRKTPAMLYTTYLPLHHNDRSPMQTERLQHAQHEILRYASGLTRYAPGIGYWLSPTLGLCRDLVLPLQVVVPAASETAAWFIQWVVEMAVLLEQ